MRTNLRDSPVRWFCIVEGTRWLKVSVSFLNANGRSDPTENRINDGKHNRMAHRKEYSGQKDADKPSIIALL